MADQHNSDTARRAVLARISGRVQGVGFRYGAYREGRRLGLSGWVRNCPDGNVETYAEGPPPAVEDFLRWLRKGPPGARVDSLECDPLPPSGKYDDFTISY